ncbi:hypothetical protein NHU_00030 [Rhodovulum sulfidophilum]|uniref:Uncharacterized protein n=1 Tax=Rhodovulum sulfidophilum TaxID=35806 RepID=A0A0D6AWI2_RHOSU|nr:hypothetical protein NHU_00030 [Rhodovulum sulfidophilum]
MAVTYTLGHAAASPYPMTHARILWDKAAGSVGATSEAEGFEAGLADTVETNSWWKPEAVPASWQITYPFSRVVDAIGIGAHTLGTTGASARAEYSPGEIHENLIWYSQDFPLWPTIVNVDLVIAEGPDGSSDARLLTETGNGQHFIQAGFTDAVAGQLYTFSLYVLPGPMSPQRRLRMAFVGAAYPAPCGCDLGPDGQILSTFGTATAISVPVGNTGWYRVSLTSPAQVEASVNIRINIVLDDGTLSYEGSGEAVQVFGAQAEARETPSPYIPTLSGGATSAWWAVSDDWLLPSDDSAILYLFDPVETDGIRVSVSQPARIGVVYTGKALEMPRMGYTNLGSADLGRTAVLTSYISEGGQLMGRFIQRAGLSGAFEWQNLPEDWYRQTFDPFARAARTEPFFIAARPEGYPTDCVYAWVDDPIVPARQGMRNFVSVGFTATGHADAAA